MEGCPFQPLKAYGVIECLVHLQLDPNKEAQLQLMPQERVQNVKPCWETVPDEQRVELLSVALDELRLRAEDLAEKAKKQAGETCNAAQMLGLKQ